MSEARVGDKVRILSISNASILSGFSVGDVVEVITNQYGEDDPHFRVEGRLSLGYMHKKEKYEIVERRSNTDIVELRNEIAELREQFSMLKKDFENIRRKQSPPSPSPKQKTVAETAREDVEELKRMKKNIEVDFHVNERKGAVVAIVKGVHSGRFLKKGIAKLAKGDDFDEDIGKAIALRRAIGLNVPYSYTNQ